jgi:hypothetical protein
MNQIVLFSTKLNLRIAQELTNMKKDVRSKLSLFDKIKSANQKNSTCKVIRDAIRDKKKSFNEMLLKKFESIEDIFLFRKKLWVSESDQLKLDIIKEIHDQSASKHSNVRRTCKYLYKWYYWSQATQSVKRYVKNCHVCRRSKFIEK